VRFCVKITQIGIDIAVAFRCESAFDSFSLECGFSSVVGDAFLKIGKRYYLDSAGKVLVTILIVYML